ncbi:hypothetical protein CYQ88_04630 [Hydrogenovibrio sp. SC-1]|uniref:TolC family protein n=1 Tax=Hydrogenovibrio sp. SC-1 TaxID=2065820 RepID=UPI000C7BDE6B|nr:TolC family protein [Hydrogenovibrio sp. SC-1]PLA74602.1 hypothetical protein CYQ88_04630 [Hydrogenovibrio sp. SC-1]
MMKLLVLSVSLLTLSSSAWALSYSDLLPKIINKIPQKKQGISYQALAKANQKYANSWIAGDVELNLRHENAGIIGNQSDNSWEFGARMPIWKSGQADSLEQLGSTYQTLAELSNQTLRLTASGKLRQLVWAYRKAQVQLTFAQQNLEQTQSLVNFITQKVDAGESPKFDLLVAQKSKMQFQQTLSQQQANFAIAKQNLIRWTGQDELPMPLAEKQVKVAGSHPQSELNRSLVEIEKARLSLIKAQKGANPSLFIGSRNEAAGDGSADKQFLIAEISLPLGLDPGADARSSEQNQLLTDAQMRQTQVEQNLALTILRAERNLQAAQEIEKLAQQQIGLSEEAMLLAETAYQQGETTIQSLLLAKKQFFDDQLNNELAKLNHLEAIANLNQAQGVILE